MGNFLVFYCLVLAMTMLMVVIMVGVIKRCYTVVGVDRAIVITGMGGARVNVGGGMLAYPHIQRLQYVSMEQLCLELDFVASPLVFADGSTLATKISVWFSVDAEEACIIEIAQMFGDRCETREASESVAAKLYRDPLVQTLRAAALKIKRDAWIQTPDLSAEFYKTVENVVETPHQVRRVNFSDV